jgi:hypothetical protein
MRPITPLRPACGERTEVRGMFTHFSQAPLEITSSGRPARIQFDFNYGSETLTLILSLCQRGEAKIK